MSRVHEPGVTRWLVVAVAIVAGIAATLHVGKVPPALPALREDLGLGLVGAGWVASIFSLVGALLGIAGGLVADRLGARANLLAGLALLAIGSTLGAFSDSGAELLATRVLSGVGLIVVAVSAPRVIVAASSPAHHGLALGAWSIYMPAGMAIAMASAPLALSAVGWRGLWLVHAGVVIATLVVAAIATRGVAPRPTTSRGIGVDALRRPGPWVLGIAFACYTIQWFAMMTWVPTWLVEAQGRTREDAALLGALVVASNALGVLVGAWLVHRAVPRWLLVFVAFVGMAVSAVGVFSGIAPEAIKYPLAIAFGLVSGLLPPAVLGGVPAHAGRPEHVATVNGLVVQGSHVGTVLGPPVFAALVAGLGGWNHGWSLMLAFGLLGAGVTTVLRRIERKM